MIMGAGGIATRGPGTVVLGVGSTLMGDDGLGVRAVEALRARWPGDEDVVLLDGGTWGMQILPYIEAAERLLIVDAVKAGGEPGTLVRLDDDAIPRHLRQKLSPHQIELSEVLAVAQLRGAFPAEAVVLGIEPERIELHDGLSERVQAGLPVLMEAMERQLAAWGHPAQAHPAATRSEQRGPAQGVLEATMGPGPSGNRQTPGGG